MCLQSFIKKLRNDKHGVHEVIDNSYNFFYIYFFTYITSVTT